MSKTLDEIRKKLQQLDYKNSATTGSRDKTVYPHWNIPEGSSVTVRLLPDANEDNTFFWSEKQIIKLDFPGVKGQDENKKVTVQVPCVEMWTGKNTCPILNEVRPWWKDESLKDLASKYWVKRTYYMQGFVKTDPMNETDTPDNPIRKFIIGPQIFAIIKAALLDPDMENSPVDFINGTDFVISKTSKGGYADYGTSKWARKETSISEEMQEAIHQFGLVDLSTYLPKRPTEEQLHAMFEMFQASLDGELYDPARWAQYYKPYGIDSVDSADGEDAPVRVSPKPAVKPPVSAPVAQPAAPRATTVRPPAVTMPSPSSRHVEESEDEDYNDPPFEMDSKPAPVATPVAAPAASESGAKKTPQEILAMLRNRK